MGYVKPKKRFGQHYLKDEQVLYDTVQLLKGHYKEGAVLEIGPGMGALTKYIWKDFQDKLHLIELDRRCVAFLKSEYDGIEGRLIQGDFLKLELNEITDEPINIIGNFPYNISSQIVFKALDNWERIPLVIGMFQKEVALRLASKLGSRAYGVISVLAQLKYDIEIAFDIGPEKFDPSPKVVSSVLIMKRKENPSVDHNHTLFRSVVKTAFSMRRKKLRNALSSLTQGKELPEQYASLRAEALSLEDYLILTKWFEQNG